MLEVRLRAGRLCLCRRGEEVTHLYSWSLERNDKALLNYFFVQDVEPPRLCAMDLPGRGVVS